MRQIILALIMLPLHLLAQPQQHVRLSEEPPVYDAAHATDLVEMKAYTAVGVSSLIQNYGSAIPGLSDLQLSPGVLMRAGLDVRFALRNSFALATGLSFDINNSKYALSIVDGNTGSINSLYVVNHFYEVTVPVYLSWRFNLGRRMRWTLDFGGYMAIAAGGKMKCSGYTSGENSLGQPIITHVTYQSDYFRDGQSIINGVKNFDYGPRLASGFIYRNRYSLNIILEVSVPNLAINHNVLDIKYRNVNLAFEFGYNF